MAVLTWLMFEQHSQYGSTSYLTRGCNDHSCRRDKTGAFRPELREFPEVESDNSILADHSSLRRHREERYHVETAQGA